MKLENKIPPPIVGILFALAMWGLAPYVAHLESDKSTRDMLASMLVLAGTLIAGTAAVSFRKAKTTVDPLRPERATALVVSGMFRFSRNPMYLGMLLFLCAWAIYLGRPLLVLAPLSFVLYMNRFQIAPEERAMTALFGDEFDAYKKQVRRWI